MSESWIGMSRKASFMSTLAEYFKFLFCDRKPMACLTLEYWTDLSFWSMLAFTEHELLGYERSRIILKPPEDFARRKRGLIWKFMKGGLENGPAIRPIWSSLIIFSFIIWLPSVRVVKSSLFNVEPSWPILKPIVNPVTKKIDSE